MRHLFINAFASFFLFAALFTTSPAAAATGIEIQNPWARAQSGNAKQGGVYMTIVNHGSSGDKLLSVSTPVAKVAQLHNNKMRHGKMRMRRKMELDLKPEANVPLNHDGLHIMLMDVTSPLKPGTTFPLTLNFEKAGAIKVDVVVR